MLLSSFTGLKEQFELKTHFSCNIIYTREIESSTPATSLISSFLKGHFSLSILVNIN